ncbi:hypothetical protein VTJ49DRAFT_3757 [Mycothermus thermophilus]|uniref:Zn(2)-C6 fungal-type domain-containing protein n=1 Tax=Humicola insolens TaxID=85995 RepID=A0ABR3V6R2_HUMIN
MDEKKPVPQAEEAVMQQTYPSPSPMTDTTTTEAQYYEQLARHRDMEQQQNQQQSQPHQDHRVYEHHQPHEHHDLHQLQQLQDSPAPDQQNTRQSVSAEDLQLAAQLTQGLAPMMEAAVQEQGPSQAAPMAQPNGQEAQVQPEPEQNLQEQLEASLQSHDQELREHTQHALADVLPHTGQPQSHHYPEPPQGPPHLGHHMPLDHHHHLSQAGIHAQYQPPDGTPPRKRSKVSRACDECRRKKIKCDGQPEATDQPCSNCRRSNAQCLFSRIPQKRGPSKGYIKELADRINNIEGKLNSTTAAEILGRRESTEAFASPTGMGDQNRKRPFSSISGDSFQATSPARISSTFGNDHHRPILPYLPQDSRQSLGPAAADLAFTPPTPVDPPPPAEAMDLSAQDEMLQGATSPQRGSVLERIPEISDAWFDRYLELIHPYFPILASSRDRTQTLVWEAPVVLQNAFQDAFYTMVKQTAPDLRGQSDQDITKTYHAVTAWKPSHVASPTSAPELVALQTLLMLLLATEYRGLASSASPSGPPASTEILLWAVNLAYKMRLYAHKVNPTPAPETNLDSEVIVAMRAWAVLVVLDRLATVGLGRPAFINDTNLAFCPGLEHVVGEGLFTLIRTSYVLGLCHPVLIMPRYAIHDANLFQPEPVHLSILRGAARMLSWNLTAQRPDPVLPLAYWHVWLLIELAGAAEHEAQQSQTPYARERRYSLAKALGKILDLLPHAQPRDPFNPIVSHCCGIAALAVLELLRISAGSEEDVAGAGMRDEAVALASRFLEHTDSLAPWNQTVRRALERGRAGLAAPAAEQNGESQGHQPQQQQQQQPISQEPQVQAHEQQSAEEPAPTAPIPPPGSESITAPLTATAQTAAAQPQQEMTPKADPDAASNLGTAPETSQMVNSGGTAAAASTSTSHSHAHAQAGNPTAAAMLLPDVSSVLAGGYLRWFSEDAALAEAA